MTIYFALIYRFVKSKQPWTNNDFQNRGKIGCRRVEGDQKLLGGG